MPAMLMTRRADVELRCTCCGESFVYSAGEQELYEVRGVRREPSSCQAAASARRAERPPASSLSPSELYR
jgi:hypothetical protein